MEIELHGSAAGVFRAFLGKGSGGGGVSPLGTDRKSSNDPCNGLTLLSARDTCADNGLLELGGVLRAGLFVSGLLLYAGAPDRGPPVKG